MKELLSTGANLPLEYDEETDSLAGNVKGYSVVVKENLQTNSYGCIFWINPTGKGDSNVIGEYLTEERKNSPDLIKNFMIDYPGVAVALNRTSNDFTNVFNLKSFLFGFVAKLKENSYVNCCGECGRTENLGIYNAGEGIIVQACAECGEGYKLIGVCDGSVYKKVSDETENVNEESAETVEENDEAAKNSESSLELIEIDVTDNKAVNEKDNPVVESEIEQFLFDENHQQKEEADSGQAESDVPDSQSQDEFNALLFNEEKEQEPERPRSRLFEEAEREYAEEQARIAAEQKESYENNLNDLLINEDGNIQLKEIEQENDDGSSDVKEYTEDEDEGEDFDVEEIESTFNKVTVTTGHAMLEAEETPLEADGSVPLINPNSQPEDRQVSPIDGPDAVQPLEPTQPIIHSMMDEADSEFVPTIEPIHNNAFQKFDADDNSLPHTVCPPAEPNPLPIEPDVLVETETVLLNENEPEQTVKKSGNNSLMGIIGAAAVGFMGLAFWLVVGLFISAFSVLGVVVMALAVYAGCWLIGGKVDKKDIIICAAITILFAIVGIFGIEVIEMKMALEQTYFTGVSIAQSFNWFMNGLSAPNMMEIYGINLITTVILLIASNIAAIVYCNKNE